MIAWLLVAWAVDMPADVDLNDLDQYEEARQQAMSGPSGCWDVTAVATWALWRDGPVADDRVAIRARFDHGAWRGFDASRVAFRPVVGRSDGARSIEALGIWLDSLKGEIETSWAEWSRDRGRIELVEMQSVDGANRDAETLTRMTSEGVVETLSTTFPTTQLGGGRRLRGAGFDVRFVQLDGVLLPASESLVFRIKDRGKVVRGLQELAYTSWTPCR